MQYTKCAGLLITAMALMTSVAARAQNLVPPKGKPLDESYLSQFTSCDRNNTFHGVLREPPHGCKTDPSRLEKLERIAPQVGRPEAIVYISKLAWDRDGSSFACSTPGYTDQCATSYMLNPTASAPCPRAAGARPPCVPVDADRVPYIAIPAAGPASIRPREFREKTGVGFGDFGVVIANGKMVPVIVADGGPANKIGEGSTALLKALSNDGKPHPIGSGVTFVLFPRTAEKLTVDTIEEKVRTRGTELYRQLKSVTR
jgi:Fungal chitosanase of glycosyl hydrolase group 75